ncbi:ABC transporter substrate-binding protein, partial [Chloroflexota bacterium]
SSENFIPWLWLAADAQQWQPVYDTLGFPNAKGTEANPSVAKRWEFSSDYRTFTISVREGIPWQGGWGELTANDVKYSIEGIMKEGSTYGNQALMRGIIESMDIIDPYTLVIHQTRPSTELYNQLMVENYRVAIICKKYIEAVGEDEANLHPLGSGPYSLVEHRYGDYVKYEAAEEHWRVVPEFKNLIIQAVPEESTRLAMIKAGQLDATIIGPVSVPEVPKEGFTISWWLGSNSYILWGGLCLPEDDQYKEGYHNQDPWTDVRVREALNIAIDREAINKAFEFGGVTPITIQIQLPGWDELEPYPYDPERAKQLIAEAGYPDGFSFTVLNPPFTPGCPMLFKEVEAVVGYWEEIGLSVENIPMEFPVSRSLRVALETAGKLVPLKNDFVVDATPLLWQFGPNGRMYQDYELVRLGEKISAEMDMQKKDVLWREFAKYLHDEYATIGLFVHTRPMLSNSQKIGEWPKSRYTFYYNFEYIRHAKPLNTWRLFTP